MCWTGEVALARLLLKHGAVVDMRDDSVDGKYETPLIVACRIGQKKLARLFSVLRRVYRSRRRPFPDSTACCRVERPRNGGEAAAAARGGGGLPELAGQDTASLGVRVGEHYRRKAAVDALSEREYL